MDPTADLLLPVSVHRPIGCCSPLRRHPRPPLDRDTSPHPGFAPPARRDTTRLVPPARPYLSLVPGHTLLAPRDLAPVRTNPLRPPATLPTIATRSSRQPGTVSESS